MPLQDAQLKSNQPSSRLAEKLLEEEGGASLSLGSFCFKTLTNDSLAKNIIIRNDCCILLKVVDILSSNLKGLCRY